MKRRVRKRARLRPQEMNGKTRRMCSMRVSDPKGSLPVTNLAFLAHYSSCQVQHDVFSSHLWLGNETSGRSSLLAEPTQPASIGNWRSEQWHAHGLVEGVSCISQKSDMWSQCFRGRWEGGGEGWPWQRYVPGSRPVMIRGKAHAIVVDVVPPPRMPVHRHLAGALHYPETSTRWM